MNSNKNVQNRTTDVSHPEPNSTLPPDFCTCGEARLITNKGRTGFYVYLIMIDQNGNPTCSGPHYYETNPWCVTFDQELEEGSYNLHVYIIDDDTNVDCSNIGGRATRMTFIPGITIKNGIEDPNGKNCRKKNDHPNRIAELEQLVGQLTLELKRAKKGCGCD